MFSASPIIEISSSRKHDSYKSSQSTCSSHFVQCSKLEIYFADFVRMKHKVQREFNFWNIKLVETQFSTRIRIRFTILLSLVNTQVIRLLFPLDLSNFTIFFFFFFYSRNIRLNQPETLFYSVTVVENTVFVFPRRSAKRFLSFMPTSRGT